MKDIDSVWLLIIKLLKMTHDCASGKKKNSCLEVKQMRLSPRRTSEPLSCSERSKEAEHAGHDQTRLDQTGLDWTGLDQTVWGPTIRLAEKVPQVPVSKWPALTGR